MADAPTPLDLDAIRAAVADLDTAFDAPDDGRALVTEHPTLALLAHVAAQVPALVAEVERLRSICEDHALCADAISTLREQVSRLSARPAPTWDEDAVVLAVFERSHEPSFEDSEEGMREAKRFVRSLATLGDHPPVKPDREAVARAIFEAGAAGAAVEFGLDGPVLWSSLDADDVERMCVQADAVLDLWPGRSEAEALREAAEEIDRLYFGPDQDRPFSTGARHKWGAMQAAESLRARADRLEVHS